MSPKELRLSVLTAEEEAMRAQGRGSANEK